MIIRLLILLTCFSVLFSCKPEDAINNENESNSFVPSGYIKIWEDHFDSTQINTDNWVVGSLVDSISNDTIPGARGAYLLNYKYAGYISENNCYIEDGALVLSNKEEQISGNNPWGQFEFTSGWVHSMHRVFFNKGYVEIKAKFPSGDKVWPAIWLIDDSENRVWPPEIDIWEYFGQFFRTNRKDEMWLRYIYGLWNDKYDHSSALENFQSTYNSSNQFHIYGFNWTNNTMKWYIDGQLVHTKTRGVEVPNLDWPNKTMCMVMNNGLMRVVDEGNTTFPNSLIIDYLRIYQKDN